MEWDVRMLQRQLHRLAFVSGLKCLEHLDLTRSQLRGFQDNAFRGLERLKMLSASHSLRCREGDQQSFWFADD